MMEILDFLYADHERVASFLSQIDERGALTSGEHTSSRTKTKKKEGKAGIAVLSGSVADESDLYREIRQTFDPLWQQSLKLVEYVEKRSSALDCRSPEVGRMSIFRGQLIAYNLNSLTAMMQADAMDRFIADGMTDDEQHANRSGKAKKDIKLGNASVIRSYLKNLPLGIGFVLVSEDMHFWFSVKPEFLSLYELDIPLKFPLHISGDWNVLGVVDALPEDHVSGLRQENQKRDGLLPMMVFHLMQLTGATTAMFGRSLQAHGISPLVIYRSVKV